MSLAPHTLAMISAKAALDHLTTSLDCLERQSKMITIQQARNLRRTSAKCIIFFSRKFDCTSRLQLFSRSSSLLEERISARGVKLKREGLLSSATFADGTIERSYIRTYI